MNVSSLYTAQKKADEALSSHVFPRYTPSNDRGIRTYNAIHNTLGIAHKIAQKIQSLASAFFRALDRCFGGIGNRIYNYYHPINPVNGEKHLMLFSRSIEKFLGDYLFYPVNTIFLMRTREKIPYTKEKIGSAINEVTQQILAANSTILNPPGEVAFEYQSEAMASSDFNAFAVPGGKVIVYSALVKELAEAIDGKDIKETKITLADGARATVNLEDVSVKDVLAALVGHEMAHVASRHSMGMISIQLVRSIILDTIRGVFETLFFSSEEKKQGLSTFLNDLQHLFEDLSDLYLSRKNEFEADITGAFFAKEAGYDPRGALYLQEFFRTSQSPIIQKIREYTEVISTHPPGSKRLRALFAAISVIDPDRLKGNVTWEKPKENPYDMKHASPAILVAKELQNSF
jgi:Zn-dependent protease with chaperone function